MTGTTDRVDRLLGATRHNRRLLVTPEGVPLHLRIAGVWERMAAFGIDFALIIGSLLVLTLLAFTILPRGAGSAILKTLILFFAFLVRSFYFVHFELAWQGRTPGKKAVGLRVINRDGGELTPRAVIARNFIREVEFFLPLSLFFAIDFVGGAWRQICFLGWALAVASLPLWNRGRLRAGDIIAGTQVIAIPNQKLSRDLSMTPTWTATSDGYVFTHAQLSKYGVLELQVLEEILRRPRTTKADELLDDVCQRICRKIEWTDPVPADRVRRFLTDFYTMERAELERGKLFGQVKEDKHDANAKHTVRGTKS